MVPIAVKLWAPMRTNWWATRKAAENRPISNLDVTGKLGIVGENGLVADLAVMRHDARRP
jgi:hypothetical protein